MNKYDYKELLYENYKDFDLIREKPWFRKIDRYFIVIKPVTWGDHPKFLKEMAQLIIKYRAIWGELDFINAYNFRDENAVRELISKVMMLFNAGKNYTKFQKDNARFVLEWAVFLEEKKEEIFEIEKTKLKKKIINKLQADEIIEAMFQLFVFNYDIVKKKTIQFMQMFQTKKSRVTSGITSRRKACRMPKFSHKPFSKSTLHLLERQSKMN